MGHLLAVDIGLRTGFALYSGDGRLMWYRSQNFGSPSRLKRAANAIINDIPEISAVVLEGGGPLADIWEKEAGKLGIRVIRVAAEQWRSMLLYPRQQRTGVQAKKTADELARRVIEWSGASRPTSLRHDAAEAILVGLWASVELGWLERVPSGLVG